MKKLEAIKVSICIVLGIFILAFNSFAFKYLPYVIGVTMLIEASYNIIIWVKEGIIEEGTEFFEALILVILALILFFIREEREKCLIIFGVWMILKEGYEITVCIQRLVKNKYASLDLLESIFIVVTSVLLIINPTEHHAYIHVFILSFELISEFVFFFLYNNLDKRKKITI